ncbi:hypothetical protein [Yoonia rosea]|uniref:hypothetical protein n=1 Tax=Yoonia rosea TaxID=287098 RepID=UPI00105622B4|nr:hypothetical protein [Yoonia rosea]
MTMLTALYFFVPVVIFLIMVVVAYRKIGPDRPTRFDEDINQAAQQAWQAGREDAQMRHGDRDDR